jgi:hypothetical protein
MVEMDLWEVVLPCAHSGGCGCGIGCLCTLKMDPYCPGLERNWNDPQSHSAELTLDC